MEEKYKSIHKMSSRESLSFLFWGLCLVLSFSSSNALKTKSKGTRVPSKAPSIKNGTSLNFSLNTSKNKNSDAVLHLSSRILQITNQALETEATVMANPSNSDIIVGKDVPKSARLILECSSPSFPVQWIYTGDGMPEISTNTSVASLKKSYNSGVFTATAALGFNRNLQESDTGEYVCRSVQNPEESVYYYIYVPGKSLFTSAKGRVIKVRDSQNLMRIPCSVTHPDVLVTMQKKMNGVLQCPVENSISFSPKTGFLVNLANIDEFGFYGFHDDPSGDYICIAGFNGSYQLLEYSVKVQLEKEAVLNPDKKFNGQDEDDDSLESFGIHARDDGQCYPNPCGKNSICQMIPGSTVPDCRCKFGYSGSPPKCQPQTKSRCSPSPCGPNSHCLEIRGYNGNNHPHCSCLPAYIGRPPNCRPECLLNLDCPLAMACLNQQCEDPCDGYCGEEAICQVRDHIPICSCPPGYSGDPNKSGKCGRSRVPSLNYFPPHGPRPGYPNDPKPIESAKPDFEMNFPCQPWPCGPFSECRPVGENAHCSCAPGYVGLPPNCRPECRRDLDCHGNRACIESKCRDPCIFSKIQCGANAECIGANHRTECQCRNGFRGDPLIKCSRNSGQNINNQGQNNNHQSQNNNPHGQAPFPESPSSSEEYPSKPPSNNMRPVIVGGGYPGTTPSGIFRPPSQPNNPNKNKDFPCRNSPCGRNALCSFRNQTIGCKCPTELTGFGSDPYVECYPSNNPCEVCGPHSECRVRKNRQPVCTCLPGKTGSPPNCRDDFYCQRNKDCPSNQACVRNNCVDPCHKADCGQNAICRGVNHQPVCACPTSPDKDPLYGCT